MRPDDAHTVSASNYLMLIGWVHQLITLFGYFLMFFGSPILFPMLLPGFNWIIYALGIAANAFAQVMLWVQFTMLLVFGWFIFIFTFTSLCPISIIPLSLWHPISFSGIQSSFPIYFLWNWFLLLFIAITDDKNGSSFPWSLEGCFFLSSIVLACLPILWAVTYIGTGCSLKAKPEDGKYKLITAIVLGFAEGSWMVLDLVTDFFVFLGENYEEDDRGYYIAALVLGVLFTLLAIIAVCLKRWKNNVNKMEFNMLFWFCSYMRVLFEVIPFTFLIVHTAYKGIKLDQVQYLALSASILSLHLKVVGQVLSMYDITSRNLYK